MKRIYSKALCGLILGIACVAGASAQEKKAVVVISTDGTQRQEALESIDRIELGQTSLTLKTTGGENETIDYANIDRILVGVEWNAIKELVAPGEIAVWPTAVTDVVNISGLPEGETVSIVDLKGATAAKAVANGTVTSVNLKNLPAGVYVLNAAKQSVKIIKK
ncbi:MAG: T9SS type A sorting domain-containing protein [Bacteroides sp.]|nr:T9SS type A sorting domain-containing protein [Bacteroides sp.]